MKSIRKLAFLAALSLAAACSGGVEGAVKNWSNEACKCKDKACAEKMEKKADNLARKYGEKVSKMSDKDQEKLNDIVEKGEACLGKIDG